MSILIEQFPAGAMAPVLFAGLAESPRLAGPWHSPTRGSIVALDAADAFAVLLHRRVMAESVRIERAVRRAGD